MATQNPMTCLDKVRKVVTRNGKQILTDDEITDAFNRYEKVWSELESRGLTDNIEGRVARILAKDAVNRKVAAALRRKAMAQRIKSEARNLAAVADLKAQGASYKKAITALIEGVQEGFKGARASAYALKLSYEQKYLGGFFNKVSKERRHVLKLMKSKEFDDAVTRELYELREGGTPGITKNSDAQWLAKEIYTGMEMSRNDANRFGANIGKLDGYTGVQTHDDLLIQKATADKWIADIFPLLDLEKTFPEIEKVSEMKDILKEIHTNIIGGVGREKPKPMDLPGQRVRPTGIHYRLGASRVLHFSDAEAAIKYRDTYGFGSTIGGFLNRQRTMAKTVAAMDKFGANPDVAVQRLIDKAKQALRTQLQNTPADKQQPILDEIRSLERGLQGQVDEMTGWAATPVSAAHWYQDAVVHNNVRSTIAMAKLGSAVITAFPSDTASAAAAAMFRGNGFWKGIFDHLDGVIKSLSDAEQKEFMYLLGEGFDGLSGHISAGILGDDVAAGTPSRWAETFFRLSGLTGWTDAARGSAARGIAAQLGYHHGKSFSSIPARFRHVLEMHNITDDDWAAINLGSPLELQGRKYLTATTVENLDDDAIRPLVQEELDALREKINPDKYKSEEARAKAEAKYEAKAAEIIAEGRNNLRNKLQGYISDETSYSIIEGDAFSRRIATGGSQRPGTLWGEAARYIMQFKGFPIAYSNRVLGRALIGGEGKTKWDRMMKNTPHLAAVLAGMTTAGYMSLAAKDFLRGYWPPRDPFSGETPYEKTKNASEVLIASMVAGGGLGIYGDFLFSRYNRFGHDPLVALSGPGVGLSSDAVKIGMSIRDMDPQATQMLNFALDTTPYVNLFYLRPVLDVLLINDLREQVNPGYLQRKRTIRQQEYGQDTAVPQNREQLMQLFSQ